MFKQTNKTNLILLATKRLSRGIGFVLFLLAITGVFSYTRLGAPAHVKAATNNELNFQARLLGAGGAIVPDGYYNVEFKLYDVASGGSALWTESRYDLNGVTAGQDFRVQVRAGYLSVHLGDLTAFGSINWDQQLWLTMNIGGTTQTASPTWDGEMTPRLELTSVPYAYQALRSEQLAKTVTGNLGELLFPGTLGQATTYNLVDPGVGSADICLSTGNCPTANRQLSNLSGTVAVNLDLNPGADNTLDLGSSSFSWRTLYADTSVLTPSVDTASAGALGIGNSTATSVSICNSAACDTITIGTNADADAISIGDATDTFSLASTGLTVSTAGALGGITGYTQASGAFSATLTTTNSATFGSTTSGADIIALKPQSTGVAAQFTGTLTTADLTAAHTWILPNEDGTICTTGSVCTGYAATPASGSYIKQVPASTAENTITPTANSVVGLTVNGTSGTAATAASIIQAGNATALNVAGSGTGNLAVLDTTNASANGVSIDVQSSSSSQYALDVTTNNGANHALYVRADGNVGIGNTTAAALLSVGSGDLFQVNSSGDITTAAAENLNINTGTTGNISIDSGTTGSVSIATGANAKTVTIGNTTGATGVTINTGSGGAVIASGAVAGGATTLRVTPGAHTAVTAEVNNLDIQGNTQTITGGYATQRFSLFGQPTITAGSALTVTDAATVAIAGAPIRAGSAAITNTHALLIQASATVSTATNSYGLTVNAQTGATNNYAAAFLGGNVGIGTTSPIRRLHVTESADQNTAHIVNTNSSFTNSVLKVATTGTTGILFTAASGTATDGTGGTVQFVVQSDGLTGIGDSTPDARLDVEPTGAVTATSYAQRIENLQTNVTTDAIDKYGLYITSTGSFTGSGGAATNNYGLFVATPTGADNNYAAIFQGGNVGIGTSGPDRKLDVLDASNPQLRLTQADGTQYVDFQATSASALEISSSSGINLVLTSNGKLGIGRSPTAPGSTLLVKTANASTPGINVLADTNQTADLLVIEDVGGVDRVTVNHGTTPASAAGAGTSAGTLLTVAGQTGGAGTGASGAGGTGAAVSIATGTGGAGSGTGGQTGGAGGTFTISTGTGGAETGASGTNTGGAGGTLTVTTGNGGAATSGVGGAGGTINITSGNGAAGSGSNNNGVGGAINITGGSGGTGGLNTSGTGGGVTIKGGDGVATNANGGNITLQGGQKTSGGSGTEGSVIVKPQSDNTTAFIIQLSNGTGLLTADTTNKLIKLGTGTPALTSATTGGLYVSNSVEVAGRLLVGSTTNGIDTNSGQARLLGTYRNTRTINLAPEYPGAVLTGDGTNNIGTMTSDFCSGTSRLNVNVSGSNCGSTDEYNYYSWTSQATNDYDIYIRYQLPDDWDGFNGNTSIQMYGWRTTSTEKVELALFNSGGTQCGSTTEINSSNTTWQQTALTGSESSDSACNTTNMAPGSIVLFRIRMTVGTNNNFARAGALSFSYNSKF